MAHAQDMAGVPPPVQALSLDNELASPGQRRLVGWTCTVYAAVALAMLPIASRSMTAVPQFTGIFATAVLLADVCTFALLMAQYQAGGRRARWLLALACAYLYSAWLALLHLLSFPGALTNHGPLIGASQTVGHLYLWWGIGFGLWMLLAVVLWRRSLAQDRNVTPGLSPLGATVLVSAGIALLYAIVVAADPRLPAQVAGNRFSEWSIGVNVVRSVVAAASLVLIWRSRRHINLVVLWLTLALVAAAVGPLLTDFGGRRYTFGWYAGRISFAIASSVLLAVMLNEFVHLQQRLATAVQRLGKQAVALRDEMDRRESAERKMLQGQRMEAMGQLVGGVAHDFNNLLTTVHVNLELIARSSREPKVLTYAQHAQQGVARGVRLTRSLVAFGRRQPLRAERIKIKQLIGGFRMLMQRAVGGGLEVQLSLADDLGDCVADPGQLELALLNLALNARDAMPGGGALTVSARNETIGAGARDETHADVPPGQYVSIAVSDTGVGIAEADRDRVFEPFYTTKEVGKGSGLGLSQVLGFVRQSGGEVTIVSLDGQGTTVRMLLPRAPDRLEIDCSAQRQPG